MYRYQPFLFNESVMVISLFCVAEPKPVAKSMLILDVKPWDDETSKSGHSLWLLLPSLCFASL